MCLRFIQISRIPKISERSLCRTVSKGRPGTTVNKTKKNGILIPKDKSK